MPWSKVTVIMLDRSPGSLCQRRYPNHPRGCPNYGKRPSCPPAAKIWDLQHLLSHQWFAIWNAFDFGGHIERMRKAHPQWTERQLANRLYWQGGARKDLRAEVRRFMSTIAPLEPPVEYIPEAHGVNVTETMAQIGIRLEWPPRMVAYQVALVGISGGE